MLSRPRSECGVDRQVERRCRLDHAVDHALDLARGLLQDEEVVGAEEDDADRLGDARCSGRSTPRAWDRAAGRGWCRRPGGRRTSGTGRARSTTETDASLRPRVRVLTRGLARTPGCQSCWLRPAILYQSDDRLLPRWTIRGWGGLSRGGDGPILRRWARANNSSTPTSTSLRVTHSNGSPRPTPSGTRRRAALGGRDCRAPGVLAGLVPRPVRGRPAADGRPRRRRLAGRHGGSLARDPGALSSGASIGRWPWAKARTSW